MSTILAMGDSKLSRSVRVLAGVGVIFLSFWITVKLLQSMQEPSQTIVCRIPLGAEFPGNMQNLPILVIGEIDRADTAFLRSDGKTLVIGLADWGLGYKEQAVELDSAKNNTVNIVADYTHRVYSIALGDREVLRRSGSLSSTFTTEKIAIGINQIGYPNIAPTFLPLLLRTDGVCKARDTASR